jgi:hypothetical protein
MVAAESGAALVCSHTGGLGPRTDPYRAAYDDVVADVIATVTGAARGCSARTMCVPRAVFSTWSRRSAAPARPPDVARRGLV